MAYSTVSQLGYMFLGLGTGLLSGITGGMFHLFTHAFFKALLFLGCGSVIMAMHHEQAIRAMGHQGTERMGADQVMQFLAAERGEQRLAEANAVRGQEGAAAVHQVEAGQAILQSDLL